MTGHEFAMADIQNPLPLEVWPPSEPNSAVAIAIDAIAADPEARVAVANGALW